MSERETVEWHIRQGHVAPQVATISDLLMAIDWLELYEEEPDEDGHLHRSQAHANAIAYLSGVIRQKRRRAATAEAKRRYAEEHGIPVSHVRVAKKQGR